MATAIPSTAPILVGVDFSAHSLCALRAAVRLARADGRAVHVLHVLDALVVDDMADAMSRERESLAADLLRDAEVAWSEFAATAPECAAVRFEALVGHRIQSLLAVERSLAPSLVVLGARGIGSEGIGAGSTATAAVRKCRADVLLVRDGAVQPFRRILVGIDFSPTSRHALEEALRVARCDGASVHALHVFDGPWHTVHYRAPTPEADPRFQRQYRDALAHRLTALVAEVSRGDDTEPRVTSAIVDKQSVRETLLDEAAAEGADLVAIGRRGRANIRDFLLGSTAEKVLRGLDTSLLAVRAIE
jgi:nucleotide-binding universal stress UspA family protein